MAYRPLEVTVISAKDLSNVNVFSKMEVYAVAMIAGDERSEKRTHADKEGGKNPTWNSTIKFNVFNEAQAVLHVVLKSERALGDREIGEVHIPIRELLDGWTKAAASAASHSGGADEKKPATPAQFVSYQVRKNSGRAKGALNLSYKFGDLISTVHASTPPPMSAAYPPHAAGPAYPPPAKHAAYPPHDAKGPEPVTAYPAAAGGSYPPPGYGYPPPPQAGYGYPQPPQAGYGYPPQGGYPPQQQGGYGYAPQGGYGYPQQQQGGYGYGARPQPPKKMGGGGMGLGLGAGLLGGAIGGMILGDMVSDASYGDGFDDGFDF